MQNEQPIGSFRRIDGFSASPNNTTPSNSQESTQQVASSLASASPLSPSVPSFQTAVSPNQPSPPPVAPKPKARSTFKFKWWYGVVGGIVVLLLLGLAVFFIAQSNTRPSSSSKISDFGNVNLPLGEFNLSNSAVGAESLQVNGRLQVSDSLQLTAQDRPVNPLLGQLYFDRSTNQLAYYNGQDFINVGGSTTTNSTTNNNTASTNVTNITNTTAGGGVALQTTAPGTPQTGNFNVSGTGTTGALQVNGAARFRNSTNSSTAFQVQNAAGQNMMSIDSAVGSIALQGTANGSVSVATGPTTNSSGSISIKTGDSSTTASGNISMDTGSSVIAGEQVAHKTFESGFENMVSWFTSTLTRSTAQAHTGLYSLAETGTAPNWGVIELLPGTHVVQGHQYYFSIWVRANTVPRSISASVAWVGASSPVSFSPIVDSTSEWKEITGIATAPAGATSVYFRIQGLAVTGETHYFDDITITDLSSSSAISSIDIGAANAKLVTIGNMNQIGATSIFGGSGITMNSGAGAMTVNAGTLAISGNAASTISTTTGGLTLTSADTATWGVGTAANGNGGALTVKGGNGSAGGNNNGGDLVLQGGKANASGINGHVVVRPLADSTDAFQIQNTASTTFFTADSSTMKIAITGTDTSFATLQISNAHFGAAQTTPPVIATPTNCGTTPTVTLAPGSTDNAGSFTITSGTGGTASTCDTTLTFRRPYAATPKSILLSSKTSAASAARQPYVSAESATNFTLSFGNSAAGANNTPYTFSYWAVE